MLRRCCSLRWPTACFSPRARCWSTALDAGYPIPGLNSDALLRLNGLLSVEETVSIFALGVTPYLSATFVLEFIKLIVPPLSRWETAKPENTRRLSRFTCISPRW